MPARLALWCRSQDPCFLMKPVWFGFETQWGNPPPLRYNVSYPCDQVYIVTDKKMCSLILALPVYEVCTGSLQGHGGSQCPPPLWPQGRYRSPAGPDTHHCRSHACNNITIGSMSMSHTVGALLTVHANHVVKPHSLCNT